MTTFFELIGHPLGKKHVPWWHYFENVPVPGGRVPSNWIDASASRRGKLLHPRCNNRGQVPLVKCKQCGLNVRNSISTSHDTCYRCRRLKRLATLHNICTSCWTNAPQKGKKTCKSCLDVRNARNRERRRKERGCD